jgi:hypothetical protein
MEHPNVGSNRSMPSDPSGSVTPVPPPAGESAAVAEKRNKRRQLLIGGAVVGGLFTLPNSAVLAQKKKKKCTMSAMASHNGSMAAPSACGLSPGCYKNQGLNSWAPGAVFPPGSSHTISPNWNVTFVSLLGSTNFPATGTEHFVITGSGISGTNGTATTFKTMIDQSNQCKLSIIMKNGKSASVLNQGEIANLIAGLLNLSFFGNLYPFAGVSSMITTFFSGVLTDAKASNSSAISTAAGTNFGSGSKLITANNASNAACPP